MSDTPNPLIEIKIEGNNGYVFFSDNGPGVAKGDVDYIFEPFFSTKGQDGRGLGLYIARQLMDKYNFDLFYIERNRDKIQSGANFMINFFPEVD
jgi:signal transduction histidine kinase